MPSRREAIQQWVERLRGRPGSDPVADETPSTEDEAPVETADAGSRRAEHAWAEAPLINPKDDKFGRDNFAARIADLILTRQDQTSLVIGVYGGWGEGKTSVLNFVADALGPKLDGRPDVVVVKFNPWLIRDHFDLLGTFFASVAEALGRQLGGKLGTAGKLLEQYGGVLSGVSISDPSGSAKWDPGKSAVELGKAIANQSLDEKRAQFEKVLADHGARVVVMIDDIDRLDDGEIFAVFKLVKLAAALDGMTYVLAFDDAKVAAALSQRFGGGKSAAAGRDFLEKIVQVPLHVPAARPEILSEMALRSVQDVLNAHEIELTADDVRTFRQRYDEAIEPAVTTVRTAKRYANAVAFALPLLKGEANVVDVLTVEAIHVVYPRLYQEMRDHPDRFLVPVTGIVWGGQQPDHIAERTHLESVVAEDQPPDPGKVHRLIQQLFPQTKQLWGDTIFSERDEWFDAKRVCSSDYNKRYFSYALGPTEISDVELDSLLATPEAVRKGIPDLLERRTDAVLEALVRRLDRRIEILRARTVDALVDTLLELGPVVAEGALPALFRFSGERWVTKIIGKALAHTEHDARIRRLEAIVESAEPMGFAMTVLEAARPRSMGNDAEVLSDREWKGFVRRLADRVIRAADAAQAPLWIADQRGAQLMSYATQGGRKAAVRRHIAFWLDRDPALALPLVKAFAGTVHDLLNGQLTQPDFERDRYDWLAKVGGVPATRKALRALGYRPPASFPRALDLPDEVDRRYAEQFLYLDQRVKAERAAARNAAAQRGPSPATSPPPKPRRRASKRRSPTP